MNLYCRDIWVYLWTSEYQGKLMTQIAEADNFQLLVTGVGLAWDYCRVLWPPMCSCSLGNAENKSTNLKIHTHCPRIFKASWDYVNAYNKPMRYLYLSL